MSHRILFIAAYDIRDNKRLRRALKVLRGYASGGQKSVFECFLTASERSELLDEVRAVIDSEADSFFLLRLDVRCRVMTLGKAVPPQDGGFYYVG
ncbi:CRISPR-associated endonuclease Cas2 [Methylomarinum sp. Ch1-1]|uniref:CRISPR-associated endoribonuclease Cas2 n=1 Tax=Methylomarinum roseum TaxID=3067653 RepID=A0AAU7NQ25_9GAMM|nr:CRISPR-associated endonuclease Cas2 [Methylomarinum sp. Ch1-1]MDP4521007.1 CRISPR-associated endonuclease Cas2 [Methylomarinum sp. Ch1-1]